MDMSRKQIRAAKFVVGLPFNLGQLEFEPDEIQQKAAWELYVELSTRVTVQPPSPDEGLLRESLSSLYSIFGVTREILRKAGPSVAQGANSFGAVAIEILNKGARPFLTKWHPLLLAYEQRRPPEVDACDHERSWERERELRKELLELQDQIEIYM